MPPMTDTDGAMFETLRPRLKAISRRIVGSEAEAEDVVQDCFLKWQDVEQAALATPAAWLTTVVRHQSIDRLRKRAEEQGRADDTEDAIRHRQEVYARETTPLIAVYRDRGLLVEVDGLGDVDEVGDRITAALAERGISGPEAAA